MAKGLRYKDFKDRIDVDAFEQAIGFEPLETRKGNDIGHCPDPWHLHKHGDTSGKFALHRERLLFNCWVCGGGSLLSLAMAVKALDVEQATEWLYTFALERATSGEDYLAAIDEILIDQVAEKEVLPYFNERVLDRWSVQHHPWYTERGISREVHHDYNLRYEPLCVKYAPKKKGEPIDDNYTGPTIILPHYWGGRLVGWQNRWLSDDRPDWVAKYTNTPDFPRDTLFNYDQCLFKREPIIVVESVPTALKLASLGFSAVATFGSSVKESQMRLLRSFQRGVILAPDNDAAGLRFLFQLNDYLERYIPVAAIDIADLPAQDGSDLGDLDPASIQDAISQAATVP